MPSLVLTAVGPDRPGLVEQITGFVLDAGGNLADSRMVNLRGQFALIALIEAPDAAAQGIAEQARAAGHAIGLAMSVVQAAASPARAATGVPFRLRTYAMDQPGIVHRITHLLHQHGINIEELQTRLVHGATSGTPLFSMELRMTVPPSVTPKTLRTQLQDLCDSLNCDVDLEPA